MNLENLNLVELNAQEVQDTDGGLFWIPILIGAALGVALTQDLDDLADAFSAGYHSTNP